MTKDENLFVFAQIRHLQSDFITKRTNILVNSEDCLLGGFPTKLFNYSLCLALLQVLLWPPCHALHRQRSGHVHGPVHLLWPPRHALHWQRPGMYTGQFIYCGRRATLSIGDVPPLPGVLEGTVTCNVKLHAGNCGAPPPGHPGTTPSSATATPTTAPEQEAPPTVGRPQRTTARLTMSGTLQYSSSFGGSELFLAKAARTTSSMLDDLQLDITLQIHERISEFPSLWHYPSSLRNHRSTRTYPVERKKER